MSGDPTPYVTEPIKDATFDTNEGQVTRLAVEEPPAVFFQMRFGAIENLCNAPGWQEAVIVEFISAK